MIRISELKLPLSALPVQLRRSSDAPPETPEDRSPPAHPDVALGQLAAQALGIEGQDIQTLSVFKRSFDARKADLLAVFIVDLSLKNAAQEAALLMQFAGHPHIQATPNMVWQAPCQAPADFGLLEGQRPVVVGFGPCGIFAALTLAQMGFKPIVIERGASVRQRTQDTWGLWRKKNLDPESNVQFGEGGAGTFSDGKLYSQIKDPRHLGSKVMNEFVQAGAPAEILFAAHPHIGTFKLVKVVEHLREQIIALGGEVRFEQRVVDVLIEGGPEGRQITGLKIQDRQSGQFSELTTRHVVLALGHSARDSFGLLHDRGVFMQAKAFSVGVRIEHPQSVIDRARWGRHAGHPLLGAADYKLVHHAQNGRAVYSFCMCPGGTVVAATSEAGRVVTNGMSQYSRNESNANAGLVVAIEPEDFPLETLAWQAAFGQEDGARWALQAQDPLHWWPNDPLRLSETMAFIGENDGPFKYALDRYKYPHRFGLADGAASVLPSYQPGVLLGDLASILPAYAVQAMREALPIFGRKIKGYDMSDAVLTGVETRTSSPLKISRGSNLQSLNTRGLYPAGEGASYAGGILSAGVDGIKVAEALANAILLGTQHSSV
ncbi:MAG: FAD-dependent oxidoreductase [Burkholderiales bacterium]|nr:FAD-dependent oxidoreductase [Burkholderiales bacterium]